MVKKSEQNHRIRIPRSPDYWLIATMIALIVLGLEMVYSSSFVMALKEYDDVTYFASRQAMWVAIGVVLFLAMARIDYHRLRRLSALLMFLAVVSLVAVLLPPFGMTTAGATRWLKTIGPLPPVQPSEFAKLATVIYVSAWLAGRGEKLKRLTAGVVPFVLIVGTVAGLVLLQPDLGTATVVSLTSVTIFFVAGAELFHLIPLLAAGALAGFQVMLGAGYRRLRWETFIDPWQDPQGKGFHIIQSLIALGSGGLAGIGLGASRQKYSYVFGSHTDAIFAIIGEELGFLGSALVIVLFVLFAYRGFRIARTAPDRFGRLLATGITCWISLQALINIGGITKSIPFTGIPLPFISYGGSAIWAIMTAAGVLVSVSRYCQVAPAAERRKISRRTVQELG